MRSARIGETIHKRLGRGTLRLKGRAGEAVVDKGRRRGVGQGMRWILLALFALSSAACPPQDVPDPPAVGASAKDGQKSRQPEAPRVAIPAPPEEPLVVPTATDDAAADVVTGPDEAADAGPLAASDAAGSEAAPDSAAVVAPAGVVGDVED
ncbi:MAG: hypothetical protein CVU56_22140 [Deltaproteobacteria bacterium HGW-Deltaproteobacteria-14]|nr:MAG: hypothetical protein CVU56_22140 [Deltaproteobacteria bacterium HGW-Deltaproteobacteria-14]